MHSPRHISHAANRLGPPSPQRVPEHSYVIGMRLFVASLCVLFFASMLAYVLIRTRLAGTGTLPPIGSIALPHSLWLSTVLVMLGSVTVHLALSNVRREKQKPFRRWLAATLGLAVAFVVVQTPALASLISRHFGELRVAGGVGQAMALYGFIFVLIVLHALHVAGGVLALAWITYRAGQNAYDHEHHMAVRHAALYWHFLDAVWIVMYATLFLLG